MSRYRVLITAGLCLLLTGCGSASLPDTIEKTTIAVGADGRVTAYLVDTFDKDYYDIAELMSMAVEDAAAYNTAVKTGEQVPITVEKVEMQENGTDVKITYQFNNAATYSDYMEGVLFYGTVSDAFAAGYDLQDASLCSVKDGAPVSDAWIRSEAWQKHILITDQAAEIYSPYAVTHVSEAAAYHEDGSVSGSQTKEMIYVLLKK